MHASMTVLMHSPKVVAQLPVQGRKPVILGTVQAILLVHCIQLLGQKLAHPFSFSKLEHMNK